VLFFAACLTGVGCGGGGETASSVVSQTAEQLGHVRSATLHMRMSIAPARGGDGLAVGLDGPFALPRRSELPTARVVYTRQAGQSTARGTLISTPSAAFVRTGGATMRLPDETARTLRAGTASSPLGTLHVDEWIDHARLSGAHAGTRRVTGRFDILAVLRDLRAAGASVPRLSGAEARHLAEAVRSSSVRLVTGRKDHLLRSLDAEAVLDVPTALRRRVGGLALRIRFRLSLDRVNRPVRVRAPALPTT
jgi:hypothetical protein